MDSGQISGGLGLVLGTSIEFNAAMKGRNIDEDVLDASLTLAGEMGVGDCGDIYGLLRLPLGERYLIELLRSRYGVADAMGMMSSVLDVLFSAAFATIYNAREYRRRRKRGAGGAF